MTKTFSNKVALVTGAAAGMGLATARAFAEEGAAVVLADSRLDQVNAEAQKLAAAGHKAIAFGCDVSDDGQVAAMVDSMPYSTMQALWPASLPPPTARGKSGTA